MASFLQKNGRPGRGFRKNQGQQLWRTALSHQDVEFRLPHNLNQDHPACAVWVGGSRSEGFPSRTLPPRALNRGSYPHGRPEEKSRKCAYRSSRDSEDKDGMAFQDVGMREEADEVQLGWSLKGLKKR